jgi:hypothetical protein
MENEWANDTDRFALAAHPGKSQGPPPKSTDSKSIVHKRRARLRSPQQESPVPGEPLVRGRTSDSCPMDFHAPKTRRVVPSPGGPARRLLSFVPSISELERPRHSSNAWRSGHLRDDVAEPLLCSEAAAAPRLMDLDQNSTLGRDVITSAFRAGGHSPVTKECAWYEQPARWRRRGGRLPALGRRRFDGMGSSCSHSQEALTSPICLEPRGLKE